MDVFRRDRADDGGRIEEAGGALGLGSEGSFGPGPLGLYAWNLELVVLVDGDAQEIVAGRDYPLGTGYDHEIAALLTAIRDGHRRAPVTLADAARTQRLLDRETAALGA